VTGVQTCALPICIQTGRLCKKTLVATVHSNMGLDRAMIQAGGQVDRVNVGDRNVLHRMMERDFNFGGESSGHLIFRDYTVAGDGLMGAIQVLSMLLDSGRPLSEHVAEIELFPQVTRGLVVAEKRPLTECPQLSQAIMELEKSLEGKGRILVRYSGTEPKLRLLAEGETADVAEAAIAKLDAAARSDLDVLG